MQHDVSNSNTSVASPQILILVAAIHTKILRVITWREHRIASLVLTISALAISSPALAADADKVAQSKLAPPLYTVRVLPDVRIRMRDGVALAVRITRPDAEGVFPAIMAYNPYRELTGLKAPTSER